jgi:large subunit ribosomal protein L7Ae
MPSKKKLSSKAKARRTVAKKEDPLFPSKPRNFRIGGDIQPPRDLSRFIKWPRYIRVQRQRRVLYQRLKVPPAINQFKASADKSLANKAFTLFEKYSPETKAAKKDRLRAQAEGKLAGGDGTAAAPAVVKFGINHVTYLVEKCKAKLVLIATDVDPIELVVWLPALCRKKEVPYMIVNNKGRLGQIVGQKKATAICLTKVNGSDAATLKELQESAVEAFNNNKAVLRKWGGGKMGLKTTKALEKREAVLKKEAAKKDDLL